MPNISPEELKLISYHSIHVKACVLLADAGKKGWYIKLRLPWLSDCYEVYIRNTKIIIAQHAEALNEANKRLTEVSLTDENIPETLEEPGIRDNSQ